MFGIKGIFPKVDHTKPKLTPIWAMRISLLAVFGGLALVALSTLYFFVPVKSAFIVYAGCVYLTVALSWSALELNTYAWALRGHNLFVYLGALLIFAVAGTRDSYESFPRWGVISLVATGIVCYSVVGVCGFRNFIKWGRGGYRGGVNLIPEPPVE